MTFVFDHGRRTLSLGDKSVRFTRTTFRILSSIYEARGMPVQITDRFGYDGSLAHVYIALIRRKLRENKMPFVIRTYYGEGYAFERKTKGAGRENV